MLKINNMYYILNNNILLNDISFSLSENEFLSVLFMDNKTKTYFINALIGTINLSSGSIVINDIDKTCLKPSKRNIGIVTKAPFLRDDLTVYDNIAYILRKTGIKEEIVEERVDSIINEFSLNFLESVLVKDISTYQRLIVSLARSISTNPDLLIFDDPISNLNADESSKYIELIKNIQKFLNKPIIIYLNRLIPLTNKIMTISKDGKILDFQRNNIILNYPIYKETQDLLNIKVKDNNYKKIYLIDAKIENNTITYLNNKVIVSKQYLTRFFDFDVSYIEIDVNKLSTSDSGNSLKFIVNEVINIGEIAILKTDFFSILRTKNKIYYNGMIIYYPINEIYFRNKNNQRINSIYYSNSDPIKCKTIIPRIGLIHFKKHFIVLKEKIDKKTNNIYIKNNTISNINSKKGIKIKRIVSIEKINSNYLIGLKIDNSDNIYFVMHNQIENLSMNNKLYLLLKKENIRINPMDIKSIKNN